MFRKNKNLNKFDMVLCKLSTGVFIKKGKIRVGIMVYNFGDKEIMETDNLCK